MWVQWSFTKSNGNFAPLASKPTCFLGGDSPVFPVNYMPNTRNDTCHSAENLPCISPRNFRDSRRRNTQITQRQIHAVCVLHCYKSETSYVTGHVTKHAITLAQGSTMLS